MLVRMSRTSSSSFCNRPTTMSNGRNAASSISTKSTRYPGNPTTPRSPATCRGRAFNGLEKIISARGRSSSIGFGATVTAPEDRGTGEIFREVAPEDLLNYGLIPEFVGRLPVLATLDDLDELSLKRILTEPKNSLVKQYQRLFKMENIDLTLAEEALGAIARKAINRKAGARGLRSIMEATLLDTMFALPSLEGVEEVVISKEVVEGTARPLYIYADRADRASDASA